MREPLRDSERLKLFSVITYDIVPLKQQIEEYLKEK